MKPPRVRLFVKPTCPWCHQAEVWLAGQGIACQRLDVLADSAAFAEMKRLSGQSCAPTIEVDGRILADFGPDELAAFWRTLDAPGAART